MKIAVHGYGAMGKIVVEKLNEIEGVEVVGVVDSYQATKDSSVKSNCYEIETTPDVIIDFSHISKTEELLNYCVEKRVKLFLATTGHDESGVQKIEEASKEIAIVKATNTSLGVNLLNELMRYIVPALESWDIELIEKHHNKKLDSPSGTARTLLEKINSALSEVAKVEERELVHGRSGMKKREKNEIGVHAVRGGTIVGEHSVIFAGEDEIIEIKHEAHSKKIFANGAIKGAMWLYYKEKGLYSMADILF